MYIPSGRLDAFYTTRISSTLQASISCITEPQANVTPGIDMNSTSGSALFRLQHDTGRWGTEYSWNSDGGILGLCVLRNFSRTTADNEEARRNQSSRAGVKRVDEEEAMEGGLKGRVSVGAEFYVGAEKSAGGTVLTSLVCTLSLTFWANVSIDGDSFYHNTREHAYFTNRAAITRHPN